MKINTKKDILLPAWEIIKDDIKVKKMYLFPGLLGIIFLTVLLVYQSIYTYVVIFNKKDKALEVILNFFHSEYILETIIIAIVFLVIYLIITPIFEGALIRYIYKKDTDNYMSASDALSIGVYRFLPLFKYGNLFSEFKFMSVLNAYLFIIRFFNGEYIKEISYSFLVVLFFSIIINVLFAYSKYIIVLENKGVFESVSKSTKLSILNLIITFKLYLFMFILNIRVIINFIVFLIFPVIIVISLGVITSQVFLTIAISILAIIFLLFVLFLGYLTGVLEVFKGAIWYYAYKESLRRFNSIENEEEKQTDTKI
ncbi:MAG: hypothetical protein PHH06_00260 [Candidatus Gracilibacteria bacterium]|nr:hypothetical protein [Candidatus Gracilibacteria bacterium]